MPPYAPVVSEGPLLEVETPSPSVTLVQPGRRRMWAVLAAGASVAALACAGWLTRPGHHPVAMRGGLEFEEKQGTWNVDAYGQCPQMEVDVEYQDEVSGFGMNFDHIPSPDLCCALCQDNPQCKAFTWVKNAGLDGCPSQCWIKGGTGNRIPGKIGLVSGVPPPRPQLGVIPPEGGQPNTLWCFSLMTPFGSEKDLILYQFNKKASIFGCDGWAVYSNATLQLAPGLVTKVVDSNLQCGFGGDSQTALNSWIFIAVWDKICDDAEYRAYQWVVKVDPDCVFFPNRLVAILPMYQGVQYLENCKYGMHGPIEVFSMGAIDVLSAEFKASQDGKAPYRCVTQQHFGQWGEDMFIDQCLYAILGLTNRKLEPRITCEDHCECKDFYWCKKGSDRVSYHPFKSVGAYEACLANALTDQTPSVIPEHLKVMAPTR
jgi:hypothetical protein